uniref:PAS domain-containing protein n=1 Tax=Cesiribacter sp. SM1 TaxID=2861196 RepID=UPI001CD3307B
MEVNQHVSGWERIIKNSLDIVCTLDRQGYYININDACKQVLGYDKEEIIEHHFSDFVHPLDLASSLLSAEHVIQGLKVHNFENRCIHKNGQEVPILWSAVWSEEDSLMLCVGRDITDQQLVRQKDKLHQVLVEHGIDMLAMFDQELNFLYSGGSTFRIMGY